MIKDTRYIIKRVIIGVLICLTLSFIRTCEVHAQTLIQGASGISLRTYNYYNTLLDSYSVTGTTGNGANWNLNGSSAPILRWVSNSAWGIDNAKIAIFNVKVNAYNQNVTNNLLINNISFNGVACYYTMTYPTVEQQGGTNPTQTNPSVSASAICFLNSSPWFNSGSQVVEVSKTGVSAGAVYLGNITIITDVDNTALLNELSTLDSHIIDTETWVKNCYNRLVDLISVEQSNKDAIITAMRTLLESQNTIIQNQTTSITNAQNQTTNAVNDTNNTLKDDNVDDPSSSLSSMNSNIATNSVISDLLLLPVTLFQRVINSINGSCNSFNLGTLFNHNLVLPCINLQNILGSSLYGVIDILLCGIFVLSMRKRFVNIFENITSLKDRGNELE